MGAPLLCEEAREMPETIAFLSDSTHVPLVERFRQQEWPLELDRQTFFEFGYPLSCRWDGRITGSVGRQRWKTLRQMLR